MLTVEVREGRPVVVRRGEDARREAAILRAIAGPGAPAILEADDDCLVTPVLPPLRPEGLSAAEAAAIGAAVAAVLARAHAAGFVHGPLRAEHLLGDPTRLLVTGWLDAGPGDPAADVAEVGRLLARLAPRDPALLATAARAQAPDRPTMAALATLLSHSGDQTVRKMVRFRPQKAVVAVLAIAAVALIALGTRGTAARAAPASPPTTMQLGNVVERDGHRWRIGRVGDVVVAGRFACTDVEAPALLRPSTGQVWVFESWSAGTGHLVATVPGATAAGIRHDGGCDRLEVRDGQGRWRAAG